MTSADWMIKLLPRKQADIPVRDQIRSINANRKICLIANTFIMIIIMVIPSVTMRKQRKCNVAISITAFDLLDAIMQQACLSR